jgi:PleD family two-component response regulator
VIVLDIMLPGLDGLSVCRKLREQSRNDTPLLMLTARDTFDDKITGIDAGADDYPSSRSRSASPGSRVSGRLPSVHLLELCWTQITNRAVESIDVDRRRQVPDEH